MKKLLSIALVVVLLAGIAVSGTMAYLTSEDSDVNVMTLGNVEIEQIEQERDANGTLVDFSDNKPAYPAVGPIKWATEGVDVNGTKYKVFTDELKNVVDKIVTVKNTGKSDAFVRTVVAIEAPDGDPKNLIHVNYNGDDDVILETSFMTEIDGVDYYVMPMVYKDALAPGAISVPSLMQLFLDSAATNEDCALFGDTWEVLVFSQAVQAAGFADAQTALDEAFGKITTSNHPWANAKFEAPAADEYGNLTIANDYILTDKPLYSNYTAAEAYTVDGNGNTVTMVATSVDSFDWIGGTIPQMSMIFSSKDGAKVTVNDLTITGTMQSVMAGHYVNSSSNWYNTEFNNVNIVDAEVVSFSANVSPALTAYGTLVMNNCEVTGTTLSALDTDPMWPVYDMAVVNYSDTTLNNSKVGSIYVWNQAKVTVAAGSEVDTMVIRGNMNTTKYGVTIKAGATVGTIDLSAITDKNRVNFTIEDGATVGKIVANGVKYTSIAAWKKA